MLDFIKSFFGKGRVKIEWTGLDKVGNLVSGTGKVPYIGLYDEGDVISKFKEELMYQHNVIATKIEITQHIKD